MKLKINDKVLCIPPYISTTWDKVSFLQTIENPENHQLTLILNLVDGKEIKIANLDNTIIDIAFAAHLKYLEQSSMGQPKDHMAKMNALLSNFNPEQMIGFPIRLGQGLEGLESAFQHNSAQANTPNIPLDVLSKISAIAKIVSNGDSASFPKPEPHCNCMHCQVARAVHGLEKGDDSSSPNEEPISEDDLKFKLWDISQNGEKLYTVTNPLDVKEQYNVFLGSPVGCTCGEMGCVHIRAVLSS